MTEGLTILVGTMTGTAELVAEDIQTELAADGREVEILLMDDLDETVFDRPGAVLICCSTYGQGDVPDNALGFFERLEAVAPDLSGLRYGIFALGDRTYSDTYCHGGGKFDRLLARLGGKRIGAVEQHDASAGTLPEEVAVTWVRAWLDEVDATRAEAA